MSAEKKLDLQSEISKLEKKQAFHKQQAQKSAARLKELLNQNRNNHLMAFGIGVELQYLAAGDDKRKKIQEAYREIYANDQRMLQRALDGFSRLDRQLAENNPGMAEIAAAAEQVPEDLGMLLDLGLARDKAEALCQSAADSGTDLRKFLEAAGQVFDDKPEAARKSTRERYLLGALKNTFNI